eukprot:GHVH01014141.1.p1 GENE.GHVH01014141.1~~GHVH01014141.1.p1  ORF type:complete len:100 (+),score=5.67 GHVH01014141.1:320-619(+)
MKGVGSLQYWRRIYRIVTDNRVCCQQMVANLLDERILQDSYLALQITFFSQLLHRCRAASLIKRYYEHTSQYQRRSDIPNKVVEELAMRTGRVALPCLD